MTEYDYSPQAYERYLATQTRIANWVDQTEQHRPEFQAADSRGSAANSSMRSIPMSYAPHNKLKRSPPPSPPQPPHRPHYAHPQPPRHLFIHPPPPESESSEEYGDGPGPMPLPNPAVMFPPQQPMYHPPMGRSMVSPPPMIMPPTYIASPHKSPHHRPRSRSHSRSRSHHSPAYYSMVSPPISSGYQYAYPAPMGGVHPGYIMMQQPHRGPQLPMMTDVAQPPRSAPANVTTFSMPVTSPPPSGYFHQYPSAAGPSSGYASPPAPAPYTVQAAMGAWSTYGAGSTSQSVLSTPTSMASPPHTPYYMGMPHYQGMHSAMASPPPTYFAAPGPQPAQLSPQPYIVPQGLHQRVYDLSAGSTSRHYLRHSVG